MTSLGEGQVSLEFLDVIQILHHSRSSPVQGNANGFGSICYESGGIGGGCGEGPQQTTEERSAAWDADQDRVDDTDCNIRYRGTTVVRNTNGTRGGVSIRQEPTERDTMSGHRQTLTSEGEQGQWDGGWEEPLTGTTACLVEVPEITEMQLRSSAPNATILARTRRRVPIVGSSGHSIPTIKTAGRVRAKIEPLAYPSSERGEGGGSEGSSSYVGVQPQLQEEASRGGITVLQTSLSPSLSAAGADHIASSAAKSELMSSLSLEQIDHDNNDRPTNSGDGSTLGTIYNNNHPRSGGHGDSRSGGNGNSRGNREADDLCGEAWEMMIQVFWEGAVRDRVFVEAYTTETDSVCKRGASARTAPHIDDMQSTPTVCQRICLRLAIRVPTLVAVDAETAVMFAGRVVRQIMVQVDDDEETGSIGQPRERGARRRSGVGQGYQREMKQSANRRQQPQPHPQQCSSKQQSTRLRLTGVDSKALVSVA